jgi:peptidoglycan/xylan/chitin deacetylase (PgdA/CDA1 family)
MMNMTGSRSMSRPEVARTAAHGVMLHHFCGGAHPKGQGAIDAEQFADLITALGRDRILPAEEWTMRTVAGTLRDGDLCITFDDALRCQYDIALPVLRHFGITAFWFVYSAVFEGAVEPLEVFRFFRTEAFPVIDDFYRAFDQACSESEHAGLVRDRIAGFDFDSYYPEIKVYTTADRRFRYVRDEILGPQRYEAIMWHMIRTSGWAERIPKSLLWMDDACLRTLTDEGHLIGLHSYSHPTLLERLPLAEQQVQYTRNRDHIVRATGRAPTSMSHPCNSYTPETLPMLHELGVSCGFRADMSKTDYTALELPRMDHALLIREFGLSR